MLNLKNIICNLPSAALVVDADRRVLMANRMAERISGESEEGLIGRREGDVLGCLHAAGPSRGCGQGAQCQFCKTKQAVVRALSAKQDIEPFETKISTQRNGIMYLKISVILVEERLEASNYYSEPAAIVMVNDMKEDRRNERLSEAMETVGEICHELSQPLMALSGQLELLEMDIGRHARIAMSMEQVNRIGRITNKLQKLKSCANKSYYQDTSRIF